MNNRLQLININIIPDIIKNSKTFNTESTVAFSIKRKKRIHFNETASFCFIPCRQEILDENLKNDLWWTQEEMNNIRYIYTMELQQFMQAYPHNNIRDVQKQLWLVFDFDELYARFPGRINN